MRKKEIPKVVFRSLGSKWIFLVVFVFPFLLCLPYTKGEISPDSSKSSLAMTRLQTIPSQYGEVICRFNEKSPNQLLIIGMSHRDSLDCLNGENTSRVQAEVYQIGDWFIHNQDLELLLPEGFFEIKTGKTGKENTKALKRKKGSEDLDFGALEKRLSDNKTYVNAEMLLNEYHLLRIKQVEDKGFYDAVRDGLLKLVNCREGPSHYTNMKTDLDYLQERRTAAMLQKIPDIIEAEFQQGNIKSRRAIFTIGMSHLHNIIKYLSEKRIKIVAPLAASNGREDYLAELNLLRENFGVSVILPRTLLNDQNILKINKLDKMVTQSRDLPGR